MNNCAVVAFLRNITPITGADKIVQADVVLNDIKLTQVVTGVGTPENTKVVYFDSNLCLSQKVLEDMPSLGTYLSKNGRVKVVKLRGIISNGLAVKVEEFERYADKSMFTEGFEFTSLGGLDICKKYAPPERGGGLSSGTKKGKTPKVSRMLEGHFRFHVDTEHLSKNMHRITPDSLISITRKYHGTSAIVSNCLVKRPKTFLEKLKFWDKEPKTVYDTVYASRSVIKNDSLNPGGFYKFDIWQDAGVKFFQGKLFAGETVYFEIIGHTPTGGYIQKGYDYGCGPEEYKIMVYRITKTGPDKHVIEYGWQALKDRCKELEVPHVDELYFGPAKFLFPIYDSDEWRGEFVTKLKSLYLDKYCPYSKPKTPDEGIVLRVERIGIEVYKLKSELFLLGESKAKDEGAEDLEEEEASKPT